MSPTPDSRRPSPPTLPVDRIRPAYEQVAEQLRELIVQGGVLPGDRLPVEADIAASFGVSRGTVREALRLLASRNLIYAVRGAAGGTFVAQSDPSTLSEYLETGIELLSGASAISLDELLEARQLLEVPAARLAAERRTEQHLADLQASIDDEINASGATRYQHHHRFHALILAASGNRLLEVMTLPVFGVIRSRYVLPPGRRDAWSEIDADHIEIMECISRGDGVDAARAMHDHLGRLNTVYRSIDQQSAAQRGQADDSDEGQ